MLTSDVNCLFTPRSEENNGKKTEIIDQPRFHADTHSTSQKCPLISSLTPLFDSTNYLALFRSYQRAIIHCQTFSVARGERNAHFSVLAPRLVGSGMNNEVSLEDSCYYKNLIGIFPALFRNFLKFMIELDTMQPRAGGIVGAGGK